MNYEEVLSALDSVIGAFVIVYPAAPNERGDEPEPNFTSGLSAWGQLERDKDVGAEGRRRLASHGVYGKVLPELDIGDAPLELYERQVAAYTFEGMDDAMGPNGFAGFALWRHEFLNAQWLDFGIRPDWLWIRRRVPLGFVIAAEFPAHQREKE